MNNILSRYMGGQPGHATKSSAVATSIPEVDMGPVEKAAGAVNMHNFAIESLISTANSIENLSVMAIESIGDGGLGRGEAALLEQATNNHLEPLGVTATLPALESFGGLSDRVQATGFAVESLASKAKDIWKAIIDAIRTAQKAVVKWFKELFNKVPGMIKKFEAIKAKADAASGEAKNDKFKISSGVAAKLHINKQVKSENFIAELKRFEELTKELSESGTKTVVELFETSAELADTTIANAATVDDFATKFDMGNYLTSAAFVNNSMFTGGSIDAKDFRMATEKDMTSLDVTVSNEMLGGLGLFAVAVKTEAEVKLAKDSEGKDITDETATAAAEALKLKAKTKLSFTGYSKDKVEVEEMEIATLSPTDISSIADAAIDVLNNIKNNVESNTKISDAKGKAVDKFEKAIADLAKEKEVAKNVRKVAKAALDSSGSVIRGGDAVINNTVGKSVSMLNAMSSLLAGSLSEYKG